MPKRNSDSVRHVLSRQLAVDQTELRLHGFVADALCSGYIADSQSVREVAEYFDLRTSKCLQLRSPAALGAALGEVAAVFALHDQDTTAWA